MGWSVTSAASDLLGLEEGQGPCSQAVHFRPTPCPCHFVRNATQTRCRAKLPLRLTSLRRGPPSQKPEYRHYKSTGSGQSQSPNSPHRHASPKQPKRVLRLHEFFQPHPNRLLGEIQQRLRTADRASAGPYSFPRTARAGAKEESAAPGTDHHFHTATHRGDFGESVASAT